MTSVSSSPVLLSACSKVLMRMLQSKSWLTSVEKNPLLRMALRETFYKQYCGGTNRTEVKQTIADLQKLGFQGVILEYALEVLQDAKDADEAKDVEVWRSALLASVDMVNPGDFIGVKWSGMGSHALQLLKNGESPSALMNSAMREVCDAAAAKQVKLLPSAEETTTTPTIDAWTLSLQRDYNRGPSGSVLYNTYQTYLKRAPAQIANHLADAQEKGYTLGVKLVRGAYLASEPRHMIHDTIEDTHAAYDNLTAACLKRQWNTTLSPAASMTNPSFPPINLVLATHNAASVRSAQAIRTQQIRNNEPLVPLAYAQLKGMADEVSCELLQASKAAPQDGQIVDVPRAFKCTTWGSLSENLNYLLRRAAENKDAATRTKESQNAMGAELRRRFRGVFGMA